jgi:transcriptional regulator with XRE-family HTH domain
MTAGSLGAYLRARRAQVTPDQAGLRPAARRRVPGLRRDEVARLAGISPEYYTRLEQGHDRHPSAQVLGALARALRLDAPAADYLRALAAAAGSGGTRPPEQVQPTVRRLLDALPLQPAFVQGRYLDVLAANRLMTALSPALYRPGGNIARAAFLDGAVDGLYADPEERLANAVAGLRALAGPEGGDPRLAELLRDLTAGSALFRALWSRHDVRPMTSGGTHRLRHPLAGDLELRYDKFLVAGAGRQMLVVYQADPGSPSELALRSLAAAEPVGSGQAAP